MELNWSTFGLEIFNFLVLVWILKALFFKPVVATIERRRAGIQRALAEAEAVRTEAEAMKLEVKERLRQWELEKQTAGEKLRRELDEQRVQGLALLERELAQERDKERVLGERLREEERRGLQERALELGGRFAARLLGDVAGTALELRLVELGLAYLEDLPTEVLEGVRSAAEEPPVSVQVSSAYALSAQSRAVLEERLSRLMNGPVVCLYHEDPGLIAGLHIAVKAWSFAFNLRDELRGFGQCWREGD